MSLTLTLKDNGGNPVSGEGTSITLNNTTETNFTKFDLYGDTEQQTYTGKNKLNYYTNYQVGYSTTINGVTYTMLPDGGIRMQGKNNTSSNSSFTVVGSNWEGTTVQVPLDSSVTYMSSISRPSNTYRWYVRGIGSGGSVITLNSNNNDGSFSGCTGITYVMLQVVPNAEVDGIVYPMVEIGSQATSFEPYVGGTASPNPDYPQEVQTVTGEQTITVSNGQGGSQVYPINLGKNLLNTSVGYTNNYVNASGEEVADPTQKNVLFNGYIAVQPNTSYTMSNSITGGIRMNFAFYNGSTIISRSTQNSGVSMRTITTPEDCNALRVWIYKDTAWTQTDIDDANLQLERGSTATTYAPYVTAFGKNLFDIDNANTIGAFITSGTPHTVSADGNNSLVYIPCQPNTTYTISKIADNVFRAGTTDQIPANGVTVNDYTDNTTGTSITLTTSSNAKYIAVFVRNLYSTNTLANILASLQIEIGSTASAYEPNISGQLQLCEIGDYQDVIFKNVPSSSYYSSSLGEGNWYVHKETGKITFTGAETETWSSATAATGYVRFSTASGETHADNNGYCNELINRGSQSHGAYEYVWVQPNANAFYIQVLNTRANNLSSFKTWLGTNPATVYYNIATPTDTQITNSALIAQLEALYNTAHSYNGATIVTSSSQYLPAIMDVTIGASTNEVTYTETELSNPLTITDIEGKSQNTTLNGNIYVDYVYNKKSFSVSIFNLKSADYATIRGFYDRQFTLNEFPLLSIPELNISEMPVFFEIGSREINSQCIVTDKLTLKFRETAQQ